MCNLYMNVNVMYVDEFFNVTLIIINKGLVLMARWLLQDNKCLNAHNDTLIE